MEEAVSGGLSVEQSVARLKRLHWAMRTAFEALIARIAGEPVYELKMAYSLHAHYCAEHISSVAERIREMRQPPYELEQAPAAPRYAASQASNHPAETAKSAPAGAAATPAFNLSATPVT